MNDMDTIQKLELDLEKLTAQKRTYEEKGKKSREDSEQVNFNCHLGAFILNSFFSYWIYQMHDLRVTKQLHFLEGWQGRKGVHICFLECKTFCDLFLPPL